ncbi:MAG: DUF6279 family lipoprotein [Gammaproteobacteria bacterium]|nr:DUF6279 family lipoprotein [Gammaproteobacteria bacterium]MCY4342261.1 DUF6279 family lipoprotein [Gammaproteobacteria bacterium]
MALANAGCGIGFLYNNLDRLVRWEIDGVLDMTEAQSAYFEAEFAVLWHWHRTQELPRYADDLDRWADRIGSAAMSPHIDELFVAVEGWWLRMEAKGTPVAAEFLHRLDDRQVEALAEALDESNADWEKQEKGKPVGESRKAWRKDFEAILKRFTGPLTQEQRALIADAAERYQPERELWADYRRRWQRDLFALLQRRERAEEFAAGFERLVKAQKSYYGEPFARIEAANEALVKMTLAEVLGRAPPGQQDRLRDTLNDRADELRALSAAGK